VAVISVSKMEILQEIQFNLRILEQINHKMQL